MIRLQSARETVEMRERDLFTHQQDLKQCQKFQGWSLRLGPATAALGLGGLALGLTTAGVGLGLMGLCLSAGALVALPLIRKERQSIQRCESRLEEAREALEQAHFEHHGSHSQAYQVKQLVTGFQASGGSLLESQGAILVGSVRLRTRA